MLGPTQISKDMMTLAPSRNVEERIGVPAVDEDRAGPGVEAVLGGDPQPDGVVAQRGQGPPEPALDPAAGGLHRQTEEPYPPLQAAGIQYQISDLRIIA